ncbi:TraR/DksA family transcriptional regulator [Mariniluteicoccus flavus]
MPTAKKSAPATTKAAPLTQSASKVSATPAKGTRAASADLAVRVGEDAWTEEELAEVRTDLEAELARHQRTIAQAEADLQAMLLDGSDGAGRDPADVGSANFERDQEMSLAANARGMLAQTQQALKSIDQGTYGRCESCGEPIGKGRLQVYPRASMCVECKQRHERR